MFHSFDSVSLNYSRLLFIISHSILSTIFRHKSTFCVIILLLIESYEGLVYVYILVKIYLIFLNLKCCRKEWYYYTFLQGCPAVCTKAECI